MITGSIDVTFDLIWRSNGTDTTILHWTDHYDPTPGSFDAQPHEYDETGMAIDAHLGDQLVFRYSGANATVTEAYIPNGDGPNSNGRIPHFTLPN